MPELAFFSRANSMYTEFLAILPLFPRKTSCTTLVKYYFCFYLLSAKSRRKSAKATNLKGSQYVVALHRDSKSGIMHLHIDANRIDMRGNVNDAHYIYERAMAAAAKVGQQRG